MYPRGMTSYNDTAYLAARPHIRLRQGDCRLGHVERECEEPSTAL